MKTLIIPDIHNKTTTAEIIIAYENPDKIVFLGDYFDSYYDTLEIAHETAEWLKESLTKPNRIHLLGNHDLSYMNDRHRCAGFSEGKLFAIKNVGVDLTKLEHYTWIDDWLCTHAGLSYDFYEAYAGSGENVNDFLENRVADLELRDRLYDVSPSRGGIDAYSGPFWCDYSEFVPIPDTKQIFGHTMGELRQNGHNFCLDTYMGYYAIYDGKTLHIEKNDTVIDCP